MSRFAAARRRRSRLGDFGVYHLTGRWHGHFRSTCHGGNLTGMVFYGLADYQLAEIIDFWPSREEAEEALRQVLEDEPEWLGLVGVEGVALAGDLDSRRN